FDDQYRGCSHIMEEELEELNRTEFAKNRVYAQVWKFATAVWRSQGGHIPQVPELRWEHAVAIMAYTLEMPSHNPMYKVFNAAVREAGRSREEYLNNFHFKVLHFLLTKARHALWDAQTRECHCVSRGVQGIRFIAQRHQSVRFGQFTSTSFCDKAAQEFGIDTTFRVQTCYGVPIRDFSAIPTEEEVLIPPFEVFNVTKVTHKGNRPIIHLRSKNTSSTYNCELAKGDVPGGRSLPTAGVQGLRGSPAPPALPGKGGGLHHGEGEVGSSISGNVLAHLPAALTRGLQWGPWRHGTARHGT
ncbi:erythroblast NAD(P)(+)--arginine ADP-ribosyltransferase-like, partial [Egretta garzetta]|uniref:erythroblast NAD(P)(+)--arginine ADP-ribosyltransferase-like n=1 Tax=Egretta garzetta TaxID=188379 RepID=UPI00163C7AEE